MAVWSHKHVFTKNKILLRVRNYSIVFFFSFYKPLCWELTFHRLQGAIFPCYVGNPDPEAGSANWLALGSPMNVYSVTREGQLPFWLCPIFWDKGLCMGPWPWHCWPFEFRMPGLNIHILKNHNYSGLLGNKSVFYLP